MIIFYTRRFSDKIIVFIVALVITLLVTALTFWVLYPNITSALEKTERDECIKWQKWSKEIRKDLFYLTPWQKEQCDAVGIKIDALVKKED